MLRKLIVVLFVILPPGLFAQEAPKPDVWEPFRYFAGSWQGKSEGLPGSATVEVKYEFILNGNFLMASGESVYPPQERNPKGQTYVGRDLISYDRIRRKFVLRQFSGEGFVNQYVLDRMDADGKTFVFVTENMENLPPGFHARKTYHILNADEFTDTFELAQPGKDLEKYVETHAHRKQGGFTLPLCLGWDKPSATLRPALPESRERASLWRRWNW